MSIDKPFSIKIRLFENYYVPKWAKPVAYISLVAVLCLTIIILATKKCDNVAPSADESSSDGRPHPNVRKLEPYYNAIISNRGGNQNDGLPNRPIKTIKSNPYPVGGDEDPAENTRSQNILGTDLTEQDLQRLIDAVTKSRRGPPRRKGPSTLSTTTSTSTRQTASTTTQNYRNAFTNDEKSVPFHDSDSHGHEEYSSSTFTTTQKPSTQSYLEAIKKNWPSTKFGDISTESSTTTPRSDETVKYVYPQNGGGGGGPTPAPKAEEELTGPRQLEPYINAILRNEPQNLDDGSEAAANGDEKLSETPSEDDIEEMSDEMKEYVEALLKNRPRMRVTGSGEYPLPPMPTNKPTTTTAKSPSKSEEKSSGAARPPRVRIRLSRPTGTKIAPNGTKIEEANDDDDDELIAEESKVDVSFRGGRSRRGVSGNNLEANERIITLLFPIILTSHANLITIAV